MDVVREFRSKAVVLHVLHHAAAGEVHGAGVSAELARHGYKISPGTLYPLLHRLQAAGLLVSREVLEAGRRRRLYRATGAGRRTLAACRRALAELAGELLDRPAGSRRQRRTSTRPG